MFTSSVFHVGQGISEYVLCASMASQKVVAQSTLTFTPPTIDGIVTSNEWDGAHSTTLSHGFVLMTHDNEKLYLLIDLTGDTGEGAPGEDYYSFVIDVNGDKVISPNIDVAYGTIGGAETISLCFSHLLSETSSTGCGSTVSQLTAGFGTSLNSATPHRVYELALDRNEFGVTDTTSFGWGLMTYSQNPYFRDSFPIADLKSNFSSLSDMTLAEITLTDIPPVNISIENNIASISWAPVSSATGYLLGFAQNDMSEIVTIDLGNQLQTSFTKWAGSTTYSIAILPYDANKFGQLSNIEVLQFK